MPDPSETKDLDTRVLDSSTIATAAATTAPTVGAIARIGRYLPIEELGRGGMGRVMRAYDPKLRREVALKVLHVEAIDPRARARMVREARTMARLSHANVVAVYDAEDDPRHGVVLVMELVKGSTLREWLRQRPRTWVEILEAFVEAGRGLAAAHDEGLLHRDFKPANVLVAHGGHEHADRGPMKVTDFGLAKPEVELDGSAGSASLTDVPSQDDVVEALTEAGTVMGTPRYMPPEQHAGAALTNAADQYAFCVALWEALVGKPPFSPPELAAAKRRGPPPWPRQCPAPRTVGEALRRGLAVEPGERWRSMTALLRALTPVLERQRRRRSLALLGMVGGIGLGAAAWQASLWSEQRHARERIEACTATGAAIDAVWNDGARASVREGLLATGSSYAAATANGVMPWLDRYADAWKSARVEACMNADVHHTWSTDVLDGALWCLEERRMDLESLIAELSRADPNVAQTAVHAALGLPTVAPCTSESAIQSLPPPPPAETRIVIDGVRNDLSRAATLRVAGRYHEGLELVRSARERAEQLRWLPSKLRAMQIEGRLLEATGAYAEAERVQVAAFAEAIETSAWDVARAVGADLTFTVGIRQARPDEGWTWMRLSDASGAHLGAPSEQQRAQRQLDMAALHLFQGTYPAAKEHYEQGLVLLRRALGADHPETAVVLDQLAVIHGRLGDPHAATALGEEALVILERALGRDHPKVAAVLMNLAMFRHLAGELTEAKALFERALAIDEEALGPEHPKVALDLQGHAGVLSDMGDHAKAKALLERALAITKEALGPDHPRLGALFNNLANVHLELGDRESARALFESAIEISESALGPDHPDVATSLVNLAALEDDRAAAEALYARALSIQEAALGPSHADLVPLLQKLSELAHARAQPSVAIALADRASAIVASTELPPAPPR